MLLQYMAISEYAVHYVPLHRPPGLITTCVMSWRYGMLFFDYKHGLYSVGHVLGNELGSELRTNIMHDGCSEKMEREHPPPSLGLQS